MSPNRKYFLISLFFLFCILTISCNKNDTNNFIKIGVVAPYEGSNAHIGEMIISSVQLYFDQHNITYEKIQIIPIDTKSSPTDAVAALQSAVADQNIKALIGFYHSSTALACKPIIQESKIPTLIYSASNPTVTDDAPYYFRLVPTDDNQAIVLADYAAELGAQKIGILYYADEYGKGLMDGIKNRTLELGIEVIDVQSYDATTSDFRPILTVMKGKKPDVVMICGFVEKSIAILNQAAEKGFKTKFLCGDGTFNEEQLIQGAGTNAEGVYVAAPFVFDDSNEKNLSFLNAYWESYHKSSAIKKKPASWSAFSYDASGILYNAISSGHNERESIFNYLKSMNEQKNGYSGITGLTFFDKKGDAVGRKFRLAIVQDGQFKAAK